MLEPLQALRAAGAEAHVVSPRPGTIQGMRHFDKGERVAVDLALADADAADYDALVIPGGLFNPDRLRVDVNALALVKAFAAAGKPIAAICHGPWLLADAGVLKGRSVTSVPTIRRDLENAGAKWVDREVVVDNGLVTSRTPKDLHAFTTKLIEEIGEGRHPHARRSAA